MTVTPRRSVRFRVTALAVALFAVLAGAGAVTLVVLQRGALRESLDDTVQQRSSELADRYGSVGDDGFDVDSDDAIALVIAADGTVVSGTEIRHADALVRTSGSPARTGTITVDGIGRMRYRAVLIDPGPAGEEAVTLVVAASLDDVDEAIAALAVSLAVGVPVVVLLLGATVWWLVGRTLDPVEAIRVEVAGFGAGRLDGRVPEPGTGDEVDRLARTMNEMLGRLEVSVERQRRFVGDASHELRGPLTRLRTEIEVARADPDADHVATLDSALDDLVELSALVEELLVLARLDAGGRLSAHEVDLDVVVTAVLRRHRDDREIRVDGSAISAARTVGDERLLHRAIDNLVVNAMRHARSAVTVSVAETPAGCTIDVDDDGHGIDPRDRERIFERFTRLDEARTRDAGGAGLGLAIAREVVHRHHGSIDVDDRPGGGTRMRITLPPHGPSI